MSEPIGDQARYGIRSTANTDELLIARATVREQAATIEQLRTELRDEEDWADLVAARVADRERIRALEAGLVKYSIHRDHDCRWNGPCLCGLAELLAGTKSTPEEPRAQGEDSSGS